MVSRLSDDERNAFLPALQDSGWRVLSEPDRLQKIWKFSGFADAWSFMSHAALCAEKMDHHPDWSNCYNTVDVTLSTHSCEGLSILDIELARAFDATPIPGKVIRPAGQAAAPDTQPGNSDAPDLSDDFLD
ncbi:4a-hydroxytetrahydrobiopterin dehydratase [Thioclava sp. SK-1]|uniref:4a-hydroxytetrahydrobiopterin dehydratase n=1 Tax=Thioclava sp. SK-1 TaxID=1889770 RepID=UPI000825E122|nr:4a-hydroxytetrahydrobiopterin dehydratase [Thioclava sp. SK-1]OCX65847.1 4a-hydroxytetrahydrobiopterin dehydratase [Thioclava sp. SK-1]